MVPEMHESVTLGSLRSPKANTVQVSSPRKVILRGGLRRRYCLDTASQVNKQTFLLLGWSWSRYTLLQGLSRGGGSCSDPWVAPVFFIGIHREGALPHLRFQHGNLEAHERRPSTPTLRGPRIRPDRFCVEDDGILLGSASKGPSKDVRSGRPPARDVRATQINFVTGV